MTYSPTTIAREASEQLVVSFSVVAGRDLSPAIPEISKIILTAAARMVAESGARGALEDGRRELQRFCNERTSALIRVDAALANLAKLKAMEGR